MKRTIALAMLAVSLGAPIAANADTGSAPASQPVAQLAMQNSRLTLLDADGNVVGFIVNDFSGLTLRPLARTSASTAPPSPHVFRVDYSRALTTQQMDDAYRAAYDEFYNINRTP